MEETPEYEVGEALEPSEQQTITFYGKPLIILRLPDGTPAVVLNDLCTNMGLEARPQLRRVRRTKAIAQGLSSARVETAGGPQVVYVLTLKVTPAWLFGIDAARAKPEMQAEIERYQAECVDVLYAHFANKSRPALPEPRAAIVQPIADPGPDASHEDQATYHETMSLWHRWQADYHNQEWRKEMRGSQETIGEEQKGMGGLISGIQKRLGPVKITERHQEAVQEYVNAWNKATGKNRGIIYTDLHARFGVPRYQDLLEADWPAIEEFFRRRMPGGVLPVIQQALFDTGEDTEV